MNFIPWNTKQQWKRVSNFLFIGFYGVQDALFVKSYYRTMAISPIYFLKFFYKGCVPYTECTSQCVHVCVHRKISEEQLHIWWGVIEVLMNRCQKLVENSKIIKGKTLFIYLHNSKITNVTILCALFLSSHKHTHMHADCSLFFTQNEMCYTFYFCSLLF